MKLNLGCGADIRHGYMNVDILSNNLPQDVYRQGDIKCIDWLVKDDTVSEIIALNCLNYLRNDSIQDTINNWTKKLRIGCTLKILVQDCHLVSHAFSQGQLDLNQYQLIIFGEQNNNNFKISAIDRNTLLEMIQNAGLTISVKRYEGLSIYIEAKK